MSKKVKKRAMEIALTIDGNEGTYYAAQYAEDMMCEVGSEERHPDGYLLAELWSEVRQAIRKLEMNR